MPLSRRAFVAFIPGVAVSPLLHAQGRPRRVVFVTPNAEGDADGQARAKAFREGLHELGWTEGRNLRIDYRWSATDTARAQAHAAEVVALAPDVIFTGGTPAVAAFQKATRTVPIVFVVVVDPQGGGFVESLARPGANITGFSTFDAEMGGKWFEILKEVRPALKRLAVLTDPTFKGFNALTRTIDELGARNGVAITRIPFQQPSDNIETALSAFSPAADAGMIVLPTATNNNQRVRIVELTTKHRLPVVYPFRNYIDAGGLMCYGFNPVDMYRQGASYVDRILRGARAAELPVQGPRKYDLVLNLKAAKAIGVTFPEGLRLRADEVVQ